jgi:menaquinol-cytochrome c reductase iron-sulfur subunit
MTDPTAATPSEANSVPFERRSILTGIVAVIAGLIICLAPLISGVLFGLDPIRRKRERYRGADNEGYFPVTNLGDLPADGTPMRFTIRADEVDAWNLFKDRTIGTVYLRHIPGASQGQVVAFTDVCPHLGCKITYQSSAEHYFCPCHASTFDLDGKKINKIPPRNMDSLDVKVTDDGRVWVKYQDFRGAISEKVPV